MRAPDKVIEIQDGKHVEYLKKRKIVSILTGTLQTIKIALEVAPNNEGLNMAYTIIKEVCNKINSI